MSTNRVRLIIVDDHVLFRRGLVSILQEMPEFEIIGEASNGEEARLVVSEKQPDLVLMDINMPVMDGISAVQAIRETDNPVKILMLTISQENEDLMGAIRAGADGYLLKNAHPDDLRRAILRVSQGQAVLSPEVTKPVLKIVARHSDDNLKNSLSERELEVLECLSGGQTTLQIAGQLFISENTVKTHIRHILEKLDAANRTEAVSKAIQLGLIQNKG